jgi:hypothetical protein
MNDKILESFLTRQHEAAEELAAASDILKVQAVDAEPHQRWIAEYHARGLIQAASGEIVEADGFAVGIWLPEDYLRVVRPGQVLTYLGPHRHPWHPNIRPPFVCLRIAPGTALVDLLYWCYEMWTWSLYYTGDEGLNHAAAQWARGQDRSRFPIDRRPLKRRHLDIHLTPAVTEELAQ